MITELETGGNIRFEEGKPSDKWFTSCDDLVKSRFDKEYMKRKFGIYDLTISRVTRIHNRFLRNKFEEKIEVLMDLTDSIQKKSIEYLFYGCDPVLPNEIYRAIEEGFRPPEEYTTMGMKPYVTLVNSITAAESPRINAFLNKSEDGSTNFMHNMSADSARKKLENLPSGHILVWKVFYPGTKYITIEQGDDSSKRKKWNVYDTNLILPEYLVEFEYVFEDIYSRDTVVTLESKLYKNKEINSILSATIEASKILQKTYLNPHVKNGEKGTSFHISSQDIDRWDMGWLK